jgi:hypothetical protein
LTRLLKKFSSEPGRDHCFNADVLIFDSILDRIPVLVSTSLARLGQRMIMSEFKGYRLAVRVRVAIPNPNFNWLINHFM